MASKKTLIFAITLTSVVFAVPPEAEAGCGEFRARAYSIQLSTQAKSPIDQGLVTECGNMNGNLQYFKGRKLDFGWVNCTENCEEDFRPGEIYVRVGKAFKPGSRQRDGLRKTCVQQFGSAIMYCHEQL